jgi:hypothetical protein
VPQKRKKTKKSVKQKVGYSTLRNIKMDKAHAAVSFKHQESEFVLQALASYYATTGNYK